MSDTTPDQDYLKQLTLLYVEDEEDARQQFNEFLERFVGTLLVAKDGSEGLAAFLEHRPPIIITDIQMPVMDGLVMAGEIRKVDRAVKIIVLTAFEQVDYLKSSINIGVNKYITKPVNGFKLHATLLECAAELRAEETLHHAASTDLLTGLANRRTLMNRFEAEKSRAGRYNTALSVIIVDIDLFKSVNDSYGHLAGDRILQAVATTLVNKVRTEDVCGRWGGEEFLVLLANTDLAGAVQVAEKLRMAVNDLTTDWEGTSIAVTISLGVGEFKPGMSMDECINPADTALYRAKQNGRNRVEQAAQ